MADDVQDASGAELLDLLEVAAAGAAAGMLVLLACREQDVTAALAPHLAALEPVAERTIRLAPLTADEAVRVAARYVGEGEALTAAAAVAELAAGLPGRLHSLLADWAARRVTNRVEAAVPVAAQQRRLAEEAEGALAEQLLVLTGLVATAAAEGERAKIQPARCPYPGLQPFAVADAAFFAGRERLVAALAARLAVRQVVVVVGPSGSGKSSLLAAGLLPTLCAGLLPGRDRWSVRLVTPSQLAAPVLAAGGTVGHGADPERLLMVDQLEELFTGAVGTVEAAALGEQLTSHVRAAGRVVLAVRADYLDRCGREPGLREFLDAPMLVPPLTPTELRQAVELPARRAGLRLDPGLTEAIVDDIAAEPGGLPILASILRELWRERDGDRLRLTAYRKAGGVHGAIARQGEQAYADMSTAARSAARWVLLRMSAPGANGEVFRRRISLTELDLSDDEGRREAFDRLVQGRLVTVDAGTATVGHEALFTEWPRLRGWLAEEVQQRQVHDHLRRSAQDWQARGRLEEDVYRGARLAGAQEYSTARPRAVNALERSFLDASSRKADQESARLRSAAATQARANRRLRRLLSGVVALLLVASVTGVAAVSSRTAARRAARSADAHRLAAEALVTPDLRAALLIAAQAQATVNSGDTRADLLSVLDRAPRAISVLATAGDSLSAVAVSPDHRRVAMRDHGGTVTVVDVANRRRLATLRPGFTGDAGVAWSPDGRLLATGGGGSRSPGQVTMWYASNYRVAGRIACPDYVTGVVFTADGRHLLAAAGSQVEIVEVSTHQILRRFGTGGEVADLAVAGGGRLLLADGPLGRLWDLRSGRPQRAFTGPAAITADGRLAAVGQAAGIVAVTDPVTGHVVRRVSTGLTGPVTAVSFSPDGRLVAAADDDHGAAVISLPAGRRFAPLGGHSGQVAAAAFVDDQQLVTVGRDHLAILWDLTGGLGIGRPGPGVPPGSVASGSYVAFTPDGGRLLTGTPEGSVHVVDLITGRELGHTLAHPGGVNDVEVATDGRTGASAGVDGTVRLWDLRTGDPIGPAIYSQRQPVGSVAFSPTGRQLAVGDLSGTVRLLALPTGRLLRTVHVATPGPQLSGGVALLAYAPDGGPLAAAVHRRGIALMGPGPGAPVRWLHWNDERVATLTFSADGRTLAVGGIDGSLGLWSVREARLITLRPGDGGYFLSSAPAPGGLLATTGSDGTARLWDLHTGAPVSGSLPLQLGRWTFGSVPSRSATLVTVQSDGAVYRWDLSLPAWRARACQLAGRRLSRTEWRQYVGTEAYRPVC